jgi:transcriptional regulator with XRE-family HTH domain
MIITPDQIRAARALLRLDQEEVARRANISLDTLQHLEAPDGLSRIPLGTFDDVQRTLEDAGAEFIDRGVRWRKRSREEIEARMKRLEDLSERSAAILNACPPFGEDDLYDEDGL